MAKHRSKFFTPLIVTATFMLAGLVILGSYKLNQEVTVTTNLALEAKTENLPVEEKVDSISPDGKYTLTMKNLKKSDGSVSQSFYISTEEDSTPIKIFEKVSGSKNILSIPDNTFSPDNKYIFLKFEDSGKTRYPVLRTDGDDIQKGSKTIEIESLFSERYPDYVITDVTGWGSYSLIVVNTDTLEGKTGPSWWFDLSNFSFIRLSSRFN